MFRIDPPAGVSGYDEDPVSHEWSVLDALNEAGFTPEEQDRFLEAWDANEGVLAPEWRFLLDRYEESVYPNRGRA